MKSSPLARRSPWTVNVRPASEWIYRALVIVLAVWVLHSFLQALLAACVTAIASWPLYQRFAARMRPRFGYGATALMFTILITEWRTHFLLDGGLR